MLTGVLLLMLSSFVGLDDNFFESDSLSDPRYQWDYVGRTEVSKENGPALYVKGEGAKKYIYFRLVKKESDMGESED